MAVAQRQRLRIQIGVNALAILLILFPVFPGPFGASSVRSWLLLSWHPPYRVSGA